jgi:hypothetical protein
VLPAHLASYDKQPLIGNYESDPTEVIGRLTLRPYEARVYRLK